MRIPMTVTVPKHLTMKQDINFSFKYTAKLKLTFDHILRLHDIRNRTTKNVNINRNSNKIINLNNPGNNRL